MKYRHVSEGLTYHGLAAARETPVPAGGPPTLRLLSLGYCLPWVPRVRATALHKATQVVQTVAPLQVVTAVAMQSGGGAAAHS